MAFSGSAGDIVKLIELVVTLRNNYNDSSGEYAAAIEDLTALKSTCDQIEAFSLKNPSSPQVAILEKQTARIDAAIKEFKQEAEKYDASLNPSSTRSDWRKAPRKIQWAISHKMSVLKASFQQPQMILGCLILAQQLNNISELGLEIGKNADSIVSLQSVIQQYQNDYPQTLAKTTEDLASTIHNHINLKVEALDGRLNELVTVQKQHMSQSEQLLHTQPQNVQTCMESIQSTLDELLQIITQGVTTAKPSSSRAMATSGMPSSYRACSTSESLGVPSLMMPLIMHASSSEDEQTKQSVSTLDSDGVSLSTNIHELLSLSWPRDHPTTSRIIVFYRIRWELPLFLKTRFPVGTQLAHILSFTGGPHEAFAACCGDYINLHWSRVGALLLVAIQGMLKTWSRGEAEDRLTEISVEHLNTGHRDERSSDTNLEATEPVIPNSEPSYKTSCMITVRGSMRDQEDVACALLWICSTARNSTTDGLALSGACIARRSERDLGPLVMSIELSQLVPVDRDQSCWHSLLTHSVVTPGFPIPTRCQGRGLEICFSSMVYLAKCLELVEYDEGLVAAGLATVLLPITELEEDDAIQWHISERHTTITTTREKGRCNSQQALGPTRCLDISEVVARETAAGWYRAMSPEALSSRRAFLGWTAHAVSRASSSYYNVGYSQLPSANLQKSRILSYSLGQYGTSDPLFRFNTPLYVAATGNARMVTAASDELLARVKKSPQQHVVLYDTEDRRGWILSQSIMLIEVANVFLTGQNLQVFDGQTETTLPFSSGEPGNEHALAHAIEKSLHFTIRDQTNPSNSHTLADNLQRTFLKMDMMADKLKQSSRASLPASISAPLVGFEFMDLVRRPNITTMEQQTIDQPWVKLIRDLNSTVLFGSGFGELLEPAYPNRLCSRWQTVPRGKDYLAASVHTLSHILERTGDHTTRLSPSIHWHLPSECVFAPCRPPCRSHAQRLSRVEYEPGQKGLELALSKARNGAVVFGKADMRSKDEEDEEEQRQRPRYFTSKLNKSFESEDVGSSSSAAAAAATAEYSVSTPQPSTSSVTSCTSLSRQSAPNLSTAHFPPSSPADFEPREPSAIKRLCRSLAARRTEESCKPPQPPPGIWAVM